MAEPTVNEKDVNIKDESQSSNVSSEEAKVWGDGKYPQWQKSLAKRFWGNEELERYSSLNELVEDVVSPKKKAPEKYDLTLDEETSKSLDSIFRKADLSNESAKEIETILKGKMYKPLTEDSIREEYGVADYEVAKAFAEKAVSKILPDNIKEAMKSSDIMNNKIFFEFARIVGKNLGEGSIEDFKQEKTPDKKSSDPFMNLLLTGK